MKHLHSKVNLKLFKFVIGSQSEAKLSRNIRLEPAFTLPSSLYEYTPRYNRHITPYQKKVPLAAHNNLAKSENV
jgi:hypothetical protein